MAGQCPTLRNITAENQCVENLAGVGTRVYIGRKSDLADGAITVSTTEGKENVFVLAAATSAFKSNKCLYYIECKDEGQQIQGSSLGQNKGFKLQFDFTIEMVNQAIAHLGRSLNNLRDLFIIVEDGDEIQIMYDTQRKVKFDSDGIKSDTGKAASDDRQTTFSAVLQPVRYMNLYLELPEDADLDDYTVATAQDGDE